MSSQENWQTGASRQGGAGCGEDVPDRQSVESLLRRLVHQVEETERRYGEALDDLQRRLDHLAHKTDAARMSGAPGDAATLDRLHDQVSGLARRFEHEAATSLDDFERLGRAVMGGLERDAGGFASGPSPEPFASPFADEPAMASSSLFTFPVPDRGPVFPPFPPLPDTDGDLSKRLVEMAHRLEDSVDAAMAPKALDDLNARVDAMGRQIGDALKALPKPVSLEPLERQIADVARKLGRAEGELAKIGAIETALHRLIERVDGQAGQLSDVAAKAATEAARLVSNGAKLDAATSDRLDAMHRDLQALNARSSAADDRLTGIIESVHDSLKELVQQAERSASRASALRPHAAFPEPVPAEHDDQEKIEPAKSAEIETEEPGAGKTPARPLEAQPLEARPLEARLQFGRAKRTGSGEGAVDLDQGKTVDGMTVDLDTPRVRRTLVRKSPRSESEMEEDLVAAARRAAQAAARRAAERAGGDMRKPAASGTRIETQRVEIGAGAGRPDGSLKRGWPLLVFSAAVLLVLSAILLYSRLHTKPWPELLSPVVEESATPPSVPSQNDALPGASEKAPAAKPNIETAPAPNPAPVTPDSASNPARDAASDADESDHVTDIAKSSYWPATVVTEQADAAPAPSVAQTTEAEPALQEVEEPALPPGVVFTVEDPSQGF
jgi:localization factor PodJL